MSEVKRLQVQIRVMGPDGEWYVPAYQPAAVLAALEAVRLDIQELPASYPPGKLREIRDAAQSLVTAVSSLVRPETAS
jgi:hypothetical protein